MNKHRPLNIWDLKPNEHADPPERTFLGPLVKEPNAHAAEAVSPPNELSGPRSQTTGNDAEIIENAYTGPLSDEASVASRRDQVYSNSRDGRFVDPFSRRSRDVGSSSRLNDSRPRRAEDRNSQDQLIDSSLRGDDIASVAMEAAEDDYDLKRGEGIELDKCVDQIRLGLEICKGSNGHKIDDEELRKFREALHKLPYLKSDAKHRCRVLKELNIVLRDANVPADIIEDARYLTLRWGQGDFNTDLIRGIEKTRRIKAGKPAKSGKKTKTMTTSSVVQKGYRFLQDPNIPGDNGLVMGQWWPLQICAFRDGAHGELEAGISVGKDGAAVSVVLSGGQKDRYPNEDDLDVIDYCGTRGTEGRLTAATTAMMEAKDSGQSVRVLRSSKSRQSGKTNYAPAEGIRYDGLYQVVSFEVLEETTSFYRFKLVRRPGQSPVRWKGWPVKPTTEDRAALEAYQIEWKILSLYD